MISNYNIIIKTGLTDLEASLYGTDYKYTCSVGVKFVYNGEMYGSFIKLDHEPTAEDVRCIVERLTNDLLNGLKDGKKE